MANKIIENFVNLQNTIEATTKFINELDTAFKKDKPTQEQVKSTISVLFQHFTNQPSNNDTFKHFYFGEEVTKFVQKIIRDVEGSVEALRGVAFQVEQRGSKPREPLRSLSGNCIPLRHSLSPSIHTKRSATDKYSPASSSEALVASCVDLLLTWFLGDQSVLTQPGGVNALLGILQHWHKQYDINLKVLLQLENKLLPLFKQLLTKETADSIHAQKCSILHSAAAVLKMPGLLQELLEHPHTRVSPETVIKSLKWITDLCSLDKSHMDDIIHLFISIGRANTSFSKHLKKSTENKTLSKYQDLFLGFIKKTAIEINMGGTGEFALKHIVHSLNVPLVGALKILPTFDPRRQDAQGNTLLHMLAQVHEINNTTEDQLALLEMWSHSLSHSNNDISIENSEGDTCICTLFNEGKFIECEPKQFLLILDLLVSHSTITGDMIFQCLAFMSMTWPGQWCQNMGSNRGHQDNPDSNIVIAKQTRSYFTRKHPYGITTSTLKCRTENTESAYKRIYASLCQHKKLNINQENKEGSTIGHIVAMNKNEVALKIISSVKNYDPKKLDKYGKTAKEHLEKHLKFEAKIKSCCATLKNFHYNDYGKTMLGVCEEEDTELSRNKGNGKPNHIPEHRYPRRISLLSQPSYKSFGIEVTPSDQTTVDLLSSNTSLVELYPMKKARKGRALVICISKFEPTSGLKDLDGYINDKRALCALWRQLGYDVYGIGVHGKIDPGPTAQEIKLSMKMFAKKLDMNDNSAILCVLSHGGEGFVCGSDGTPVETAVLLKYLDNENCRAMVGKPKVVIIQACNGVYDFVS